MTITLEPVVELNPEATTLLATPPAEARSALLGRRFILFAIGQQLTQLAGGLLYFALPLYVLLETGNPALMGTVLALAALPQILLMPMGGAIADRIDKRRFLAGLNLTAAGAVLVWLLATDSLSVVPAVAILMLAYLGIEALLSPTMESVIPAIVPEEQLVRANSITFALGFGVAVGAPALGGALLTSFGLSHALWLAVGLFALAAIAKSAVKIPRAEHETIGPLVRTVIGDLRDAARFVARGDRGLRKFLLIDVAITFALAPLQLVVLPSLLVRSGLTSGQIGWAMGATMAGGAIAVILVGALGERATVRLVRPLVILATCAAATTGLVFFADLGPVAAAVVLAGGLVVTLGAIAAFGVLLYTYIGERTPEHLTAKIFALSGSGSVAGVAAGNWVFGVLVNRLADTPAIAILLASLVLAVAAFAVNTTKLVPAEPADVSEAVQ